MFQTSSEAPSRRRRRNGRLYFADDLCSLISFIFFYFFFLSLSNWRWSNRHNVISRTENLGFRYQRSDIRMTRVPDFEYRFSAYRSLHTFSFLYLPRPFSTRVVSTFACGSFRRRFREVFPGASSPGRTKTMRLFSGNLRFRSLRIRVIRFFLPQARLSADDPFRGKETDQANNGGREIRVFCFGMKQK